MNLEKLIGSGMFSEILYKVLKNDYSVLNRRGGIFVGGIYIYIFMLSAFFQLSLVSNLCSEGSSLL